jgi:hypothetical protein
VFLNGGVKVKRTFVSIVVAIFAMTFALSGTALAIGNDSNDQRMDKAPLIPCQGLYTAGVGLDPATRPNGGATVGTPGYVHVFENDNEMCHHRADPPGE